jgi:hypothetical protein
MDYNLKPSRLGHRSTTDRKAIMAVLQESRFCTVSCVSEGLPFSLPTGYCLVDDELMIHGSSKSHFLQMLKAEKAACVTTFLFDGLVLAASAFHHSVNYRSVVIHGESREIADRKEKLAALQAFTDQMVPGRWEHLRPITVGEINATTVLAFPTKNASLKFREGPPSFEQEDAGFPVWTGVLPVSRVWNFPVSDPGMQVAHDVPGHVMDLMSKGAF